MRLRFIPVALAAAACVSAHAETARPWTLAANARFEIYSQLGPESARTTLLWLEQLRALLIRETGMQPDRLRPARLIGFAAAADYRPYRLTSTAEAHYVGTEGRDYIAMALDGPRAPGIAAHEYAHMALHSAGLRLPHWLAEGIAEFCATLRTEAGSVALGGDRPAHSQLLRREAWIPLAELLRVRHGGDAPTLFYAQSWALLDMLARAPEYGRLRALIASLAALPPEDAFASVYGATLDRVTADLRAWTGRRKPAELLRLAPLAAEPAVAHVSEVPRMRAQVMLATLLLDSGERERAEAVYRELLREGTEDGDVHAGLGTAALQRGDRDEARERWSRALALGVTDDALCYRYAALAQAAGLGEQDIRPVLERAAAVRPAFDDAHFSLALMDKNAGRFESALAHLRAMRAPGPNRAFAYWSAMSDALNALDRHQEAEAAARTAASHAATAEERVRASELAWIARTEVAVQAVPDAQGRPRMVTRRIPRRTEEWNPFVEPADNVRTITGALREIECGGPATRIVVEADESKHTFVIADPTRVQMRNAPPEFTCGPQSGEAVVVVYAAPRSAGGDAVVRGIEFRR
jgi:tetratricopeptide (TPR) repeat protein